MSFTQQLIITFQERYPGPANGTLSRKCVSHHPGRDPAAYLGSDSSAKHVYPMQGAGVGTDLIFRHGHATVWVKVWLDLSVFCSVEVNS